MSGYMLQTDEVDRDHLALVAFVSFLPPVLCSSEGSHKAQPRWSGASHSYSVRPEYLRKLFGILLCEQFAPPPPLFIQSFVYIITDSVVFYLGYIVRYYLIYFSAQVLLASAIGNMSVSLTSLGVVGLSD